jgi:hypothetical protein
MSKSALLDLVADSRRKTLFHEEDGKTYVESRQDVEPILEAARIMADEVPGKEFRHAAFVPETVLNQAFVEGWFHDPGAWKAWANDPANRDYRTWGGRL